MVRDYTLEQHRAALLPGPAEGSPAVARDIAIIDAMTEADRAAPDRLTDDDRSRIATAAGATPGQVQTLCEQYLQMREVLGRVNRASLWQRVKSHFWWVRKSGGGD